MIDFADKSYLRRAHISNPSRGEVAKWLAIFALCFVSAFAALHAPI
jgi:hypothetical protein